MCVCVCVRVDHPKCGTLNSVRISQIFWANVSQFDQYMVIGDLNYDLQSMTNLKLISEIFLINTSPSKKDM